MKLVIRTRHQFAPQPPQRASAASMQAPVLSDSTRPLAAATALDAFCAIGLSPKKGGRNSALADYRDRSGFPRGVEAARGAARGFRPAAIGADALDDYPATQPHPA